MKILVWLKHHLWILLGIWKDDSRDVRRVIKKYVKRGDVVVDVGAHVGRIAGLMLKNVGETGIVFAFEPCPPLFEEFWKRFWDDARVVCWPIALGRTKKGRVSFFRRACPGHSSLSVNGLSDIVGIDRVEVRTLDSFGFNRVDFLKIDTEGTELDVLVGAQKTIERCRPIIFVECWPDKKQEMALMEFLSRFCYCLTRYENDILAVPQT